MSHDIQVPSPEGPSPHEEAHVLLVRAVQGCVLLLLDTAGKILICNPAVLDITGHADQELHGKSYSCLFSKVDQRNQVPGQVLIAARNNGRYETDGWLHRKDSTTLWASLSLSPGLRRPCPVRLCGPHP